MNEQRYPLFWPAGWARTPSHQRKTSAFRRPVSYAARWHSMEEAAELLSNELERLRAIGAILSTNIEVRLDGRPYSGRAKPNDTGAAVYFTLKGKRLVLAGDRWDRVECNVWAIAKHVESLRAQERWGVGSVEQAFAGYAQLTSSASHRLWWEVLGCPPGLINAAQLESLYRAAAKRSHPDVGGSNEAMAEVNAAYEAAKKERGLS
jgi:hypothetical protein